jgi:hypothetical protein
VKSINRRLGEAGPEPLQDDILKDNFETYWPRLEEGLAQAEAVPMEEEAASEPPRDNRDILREILELARNQERRLSAIEGRFVGPSPSASLNAPSPYKNDFYKVITARLMVEEPNVSDLIERLSNWFQELIPGTLLGLRDVGQNGVQVTINFPYPVDEDFVDELLHKMTLELGVKSRGYSSSPAW